MADCHRWAPTYSNFPCNTRYLGLTELLPNPEDQMMHGRYPKVLEQIVIDSMNDHESLATTAIETPENLDYLARLVLSLAHQRESEQAAEGSPDQQIP